MPGLSAVHPFTCIIWGNAKCLDGHIRLLPASKWGGACLILFHFFFFKFPTIVGVRWLANSHLFIVTQFSSCSSSFGSPLLAHCQFVMAAASNRSLVLMMDNTTIKRRWKIANLKVNSQIWVLFKLAIWQGTFQFGIGSQKYWRWAYRKVNQIEKLELPRTSVQGTVYEVLVERRLW